MKRDTTSTNLQELLIPGIIRYMTTVIIGFLGIHAGFRSASVVAAVARRQLG